MGVDEAGKHGGAREVGHLPAVRGRRGTRLHADNDTVLDEHQGAARDRLLAIERDVRAVPKLPQWHTPDGTTSVVFGTTIAVFWTNIVVCEHGGPT